jgi:hypothetical protein
MFSLLVMRTPESFPANVRILMLAISVAALVPIVATYVVTLPWKQRVLATVAINFVAGVAFAVFGHNAIAQVVRAAMIECSCEWWNFICCLV